MTDTTTNYTEDKAGSFNLRLFFLKYLRYWYWFVLCIGLTLGAAYWHLRYMTPIYQVSAVLLIKNNPKSTSDAILKEAEGAQGSKVIENEIELLKSRTLMLRVVDALGLTVSYYKQGEVRSDEELYTASPIQVYPGTLSPAAYQGPLYVKVLNRKEYELQDKDKQRKGKFPFNQMVTSDYGTLRVVLHDSKYQKEGIDLIKVAFDNRENVAQHYKSDIGIDLLNQKSTVLKLTLEDAVPAKGKAVLQKLLEVYTSSVLADKNLEATKTLRFIDDRLRPITQELNNVERDVETYKSAEGITDLSEQGTMYLGSVNTNDAKLNEIDINLNVLDGVENYLKSSLNGVAPATLAVSDPILTELLMKLNGLYTQQEKYARSTQADNPFLQTVTNQVASTKIAIRENIANQRQNLLLTRDNIELLNQRLDASIRTIPHKEREFVSLKRQQGIKESLYLLLLQKKEETAISYASTVTDSRIVDDAYSVPYPIKPNPKNIYLVAFLAGLLIPISGISIGSLLNNKIQTRKEIENETGLAVFGEIIKKPKKMKGNVIDISSSKVIAEQFKMIRANLPVMRKNSDAVIGQTILITSSISGEGKSFVSINLASSIAQIDKRVIILELDLRKPKITNYLGLPNGKVTGMSDYLAGKIGIDELIRPTGLNPNMDLISSGPIPQNPSELLSNGRIGELLEELRQRYDYIILDTPPMAFVADTTLLGPYVDTAFYIIRHEYTPKNCIQLLSNLSTSQKFKSLHVIFNGVDYNNSQEFEYGYGYRYAYKYNDN